MSVYGDMLGFFPELLRDYETFEMSPATVAGYEPRRNEGKIRGILQFIKSGTIDFEGDTSVDVSHPTFWTRKTMSSEQYLMDEDTMYRRVAPNMWKRIGGYNVYVLEIVAGVDNRQTPSEVVDGGLSQYD